VVVTIAFGRADIWYVTAFLSVAIALGVALSLAAVALEELSFRRYPRIKDLINLCGLAIVENFGYRQLSSWWRFRGTVSALRRKTGWGELERKGFLPAATSGEDTHG